MKRFLTSIIVGFCLFAFVGCVNLTNSSSGGQSSEGAVAKTYTVTFTQEGCEPVCVVVAEGEALTELPTPQAVVGHTVVWESVELREVRSDTTVNAVVTPNQYTIRYHVDAETSLVKEQTVVYGQEFELAVARKEGYEFLGWVIKGTNFVYEDGTYLTPSDVELAPLFKFDENHDRFWSGMI